MLPEIHCALSGYCLLELWPHHEARAIILWLHHTHGAKVCILLQKAVDSSHSFLLRGELFLFFFFFFDRTCTINKLQQCQQTLYCTHYCLTWLTKAYTYCSYSAFTHLFLYTSASNIETDFHSFWIDIEAIHLHHNQAMEVCLYWRRLYVT